MGFRANTKLDYGASSVPALTEELRALLESMGADSRSPFSWLVRPGDKVVLKPNLVFDRISDPRAVLTNGWFIKAVCDLVLEALGGRGTVVIADVPLQSARFDRVVQLNELDRVMEEYRRLGAPVELRDLRQEYLEIGDDGIHRGLRRLPGDPSGYQIINLGPSSELEALGAFRSRFAVGDYDKDSTTKYHMSSERNEYLITNTVLSADVVINLPKFKTHKKTGITCALKNLVGICGHKSYLPHFREGRPINGGDEFAIDHPIKELQRNTVNRLKSTNVLLYRTVRAVGRLILKAATLGEAHDLRTVMAGSWHGNDTLWRTVLDLNKILTFADAQGRMQLRPARRCFAIVDGIYGGDNDGPMLPDLRRDGVLVAGREAVLVDLVVCLLMGFDPRDIRLVRNAFDIERYPLTSLSFTDCLNGLQEYLRGQWPLPNLNYRLPEAWDGHVRKRAEEFAQSE